MSADPTPNRWYTYGVGRWPSPDPLGGDVSNPQSLNRYAYVLNDPGALTDPSGLLICGVVTEDGRVECWGALAHMDKVTVTNRAIPAHIVIQFSAESFTVPNKLGQEYS